MQISAGTDNTAETIKNTFQPRFSAIIPDEGDNNTLPNAEIEDNKAK